MVNVEIVVALIAWAGILMSYFTIESFNLKQWKNGLKYVFYGFILYFVYKAIAANGMVGDLGAVGAVFKIIFVISIAYGVYKIKETADLVGY